MKHSYEEHAQVRELLESISTKDPQSKEWMDQFKELKNAVEHHVKEEETEVFPKTKDGLPKGDLEKLGDDLKREKDNILQKKSAMKEEKDVDVSQQKTTAVEKDALHKTAPIDSKAGL